MAKELIPYVTGKTLANIVVRWFNLAGQALIASGVSAGSFENYNNANLSTYRVAVSAEQGTTGVYEVTVPTSSVLPITMPFVVEDLGTGQIVAAGVTALDAAGVAVDLSVLGGTPIDGKSVPDALKIIGAMVGGKLSGANTNTEIFVGLDGVTTRATVTADAQGNRSAVVYG